MADAPTANDTPSSPGTPETVRPEPRPAPAGPLAATPVARAAPPPLPVHRGPRPPPLPGTRPHSGPVGPSRRLLSDVVTLPPIPSQDVERFFWPAVTPARAHPVIPPAPVRRTHGWVLGALALSVSGAFAAGLWAGRVVERQKQDAVAQASVQREAPLSEVPLAVPEWPLTAPVPLLSPAVHAPGAVAVLAPRAGVSAHVPRAPADAAAQPWGREAEDAFALLQPSRARPSPLLEVAPRPVVHLADAPFESPLTADDREVGALMDALPGLAPTSRRLSVEKTRTVWLPPAPASVQELPEALSRDDVLAVLLAHKDELVECVREQQAATPELHGTLSVRWTIRPAGATANVVVESNELRDTPLARCARRRIGAWTFPAHRTQMGPVRVPFTF